MLHFERCEDKIKVKLRRQKDYCIPLSAGPLRALESSERRGQKSDLKDFPFYYPVVLAIIPNVLSSCMHTVLKCNRHGHFQVHEILWLNLTSKV